MEAVLRDLLLRDLQEHQVRHDPILRGTSRGFQDNLGVLLVRPTPSKSGLPESGESGGISSVDTKALDTNTHVRDSATNASATCLIHSCGREGHGRLLWPTWRSTDREFPERRLR